MDRKAYLAQIDRVIAQGPYQPNWNSLAEHPIPAWYQKEKFGIFIHWGLFTVPQFDSEWYSRNMYIQGSRAYEHHLKTYGPHSQFGYKDFIPLFKGERFDPAEWARLFREAGAQFVSPVAEHHDGFQMYASDVSEWNIASKGMKRDVLGELKAAIMEEDMRFCTSTHRVEHWWFMSHGLEFDSDIKQPMKLGDFYWPATPEPENLHNIFSEPAPSDEFMEDWLIRCCELVDRYRPTVLYFDWWVQHSAVKPWLKRFAAYYYNRGVEWGTGCVIVYKHDAFAFGCAVPDVERGQFAEAKPYPWQSDTSIARNSWCYTEGNQFKPALEILWDLIDVVSKNGRMLLNVGPKADGSICEEEQAVLREIGGWLKVNGEAIYNSRVWRICQEGPTKTEECQFSDGVAKQFTSEDIRYTCRGEGVYAMVMVWPANGEVCLKSLREADANKLPPFHGVVRKVEALGHGEVAWTRDEQGMHISAPQIQSDLPVTIKMTVA